MLAASEAKRYTKNVAIVLYDGVELLDFAGPAEVFQAASNFGANGQDKAFSLYTVSRRKAPVISQGFLHVVPDYSIEDSPKPDILILPGGGSGAVTGDAAWIEWVKTAGQDAEHVLTVCTGAFIAGHAGLLEGIEATTWYNAVPGLARQFPNTRVLAGRRFVDNGKIIRRRASPPASTGPCTWWRGSGRYVADRTAEYMEYKWAPESYLSSRYAQLNPRLDSRGRTLQQASITVREGNPEAAIAVYRSLVAADRNDGEALARPGPHAARDEALQGGDHGAPGSGQSAGPARHRAGQPLLRICATGEKEKAIDAAARAIEAGYRVKASYENDSDLAMIRDDARFQALLSKL